MEYMKNLVYYRYRLYLGNSKFTIYKSFGT